MKRTGNEIGNEGAGLLSEALKHNAVLNKLCVWSDFINNEKSIFVSKRFSGR